MRIPNTSPTQIRLYARCPRSYWYTYPNGERQPAGPGAELGSRLHSEFEDVLTHGQYRALELVDPRVLAAIRVLHPHEARGVLESWVQVGDVRGRVDLLVVDGDCATVLDLKTTSNAKYALSADELATDIQMVCYGLAVAEAHPDVRFVTLVHVYTLTKGAPRAWRAATSVHVDALRKHYDRHIAPLVAGARALWTETEPPPPLENAPHTPACNAYGGCPFRSRCGERFPLPEQDPMVGLVEALYERLADENRAEFDSMCEHTDFAAWQSEDLAGAYDVLKAMCDTQPKTTVVELDGDTLLRDMARTAPRGMGVSELKAHAAKEGVAVTDEDIANLRAAGFQKPQPVLPPDATENAAIDPLDVPLTEVDGVGKTVAERWENENVRTVREYVEHSVANDECVMDVDGWTQAKHDAVLAYAAERDRVRPEAPQNADAEHYQGAIDRLCTQLLTAQKVIDHALSVLEELE